ncbi:sporulation protein [Bacillus sp. B1-b2]|uniref:sporulation protein n=1 Tax=Bacillus sp. B1-b2 TaxID=2653201 RepID=UPI0012618888|nr:sporulation protein [Bacillus sp. B1-b2]KAB7667575.1 sporulation protein [Bacillus sp. B1-b2]
MIIKKGSFLLSILSICFLLTGCNDEYNDSRWSLFKKVDPEPMSINKENSIDEKAMVEDIKKETASVSSIFDVAVIRGKKETLIAYKVKHMARFKMKSIEEELKEKLKSKYPDETFIVSSDFKIFLETMRLWDLMQDPAFSEKKANKRLEDIVHLNNELT